LSFTHIRNSEPELSLTLDAPWHSDTSVSQFCAYGLYASSLTELIVPEDNSHPIASNNKNNHRQFEKRIYTGWPKKVIHYQIIKKLC